MKKGIIIFTTLLIIIAIVLVIVFVTLFKERDTEAVSDKVISVVDEGYLSENSDKETITDYLQYMLDNTDVAYNEILYCIYYYDLYDKLGDFYRAHIIFTSYNSTYKANKNDVIKGFNNAASEVQDMVEYINSSTAGNNQSWEERTWDDVRVMMFEFIEQNNRAFIALGNIYTACGDSEITNNDYTAKVLEEINNYLLAYDDANTETRLSNVTNACNMASSYLTDELIYGYLFDSVWQAYISDLILNETESVYYADFIVGGLSK